MSEYTRGQKKTVTDEMIDNATLCHSQSVGAGVWGGQARKCEVTQ